MFSFILAGPNGKVKYLYFKKNLFCEIFVFILQMFLTFTLGDLSVSWAAKHYMKWSWAKTIFSLNVVYNAPSEVYNDDNLYVLSSLAQRYSVWIQLIYL